uniref:ATFYPP3 (FLOWER-SPECIFIC, PHYTOCHROME-ASSOCIATED PROTEIN PHOSPHATASE 3) n=1 Tax=Arundo donax TaxID=35708 RepID=A0A0A9F7K0_ARUDO
MPSSRKELHQVMELPMDVAAHRHGAVDRLHVRLLDENLLHEFAEGLELVLGEVLACCPSLTLAIHRSKSIPRAPEAEIPSGKPPIRIPLCELGFPEL